MFIGLPDRAARAAILGVVLEGERLAADVDVARLVERTEGYSGSDLRQLCIQAAMRPVRTFLERGGGGSDKAEAVAAEAGAGSAAGAACQEAEEEGVAAGESGTQDSMQLTRHGGATANGGEAGSAASAAHSRSASLASSAGMEQQPEVALAPGSSSSAGGSAAAASLRMVPRLGSLLREAESIARLPANPKTELRPTSMQAGGGRLAACTAVKCWPHGRSSCITLVGQHHACSNTPRRHPRRRHTPAPLPRCPAGL